MSTGAAAPTGGGADAVTWLSAFVVVLLILPTRLVVSQLGAIGAPATIFGLVLLLWWGWEQVHREWPGTGLTEPVRWAALILVTVVLLSYGLAMIQPIPAADVLPADTWVIRLACLLGLVLLANDGILTIRRMHVLVTVLVIGASAVSLLAIIQFGTGQLWVDRINIPGLTESTQLVTGQRDGFIRPTGTSTHVIEFGSFITMVLPLAIMDARTRIRRYPAWSILVALIVLAALVSISRTAILCLLVGMLVIAPALPKRWRWGFGVAAVIVVGVAGVLFRGLLGTLIGLFSGFFADPSVQSRTGSYAIAWDFLQRHPLVGNGVGTFLPKYWILDNTYLQLLVESGVLGLVAMLGFLATALVVAWKASRRLPEGPDRDIAVGLVGGIAAGAVGFAFFDGLSFPQAASILFLLVGMAGAYWRLARQPFTLPARLAVS